MDKGLDMKYENVTLMGDFNSETTDIFLISVKFMF